MASTAPVSRPANPTSPAYSDDLEFVTAYLAVRALSDSSRVYAYVLWIALGAFLLLWSLLHHLHLRRGYLGALWSKWALRRRTWRKKHALALAKANGQPHRQPYSFPSNAQMFTVVLILVVALTLSFVGPDNLAPGSYFWTLSQYPYATTSGFAKRDYSIDQFMQFAPQYTIPKAWWTMGDRTGLIAFALFPLCVLFAMKSPPFAILSLSFTVQVFCDKLMLLHKATAWLIYLLTILHVALWSVQLLKDHRDGKVAYALAWQYEKFLFAWTAFGCMTMVFLLSIAPMRKKHYEAFWFLHVLFVPLTIVMSALHHPPVWWWCWAALGIWIGERCWRFTWWLYINGFVGGKLSAPSNKLRDSGLHNKKLAHFQRPKVAGMSPYAATPLSASSLGISHYPPNVQLPGLGVSLPTDYVAPPGFAHAELLPGRTVRLRIVTPGYLIWAPGQHFLISIPAITRFTSHPFTTASICDEQNQYDDGRVLVFLIRAKGGWTKDLWDTIAIMHARGQQFVRDEKPPPCEMPGRGVLLRACVDGPFGSSARASWGDYSSVLIVAGGSGVSYGLSVLQYICLCMAGRDGRFLGGRSGGYGQRGYKTSRVRFVWLVREFGHIQWCAPVLRKCMEVLVPSQLQIDIFVTNVRPEVGSDRPVSPSRVSFAPLPTDRAADLEPPRPGFARPESRASISSEESAEHEDSDLDLSYYTDMVQDQGELGHEEHVLDLTNWEGDDDTHLPGEAQFHLSIKKEGRWRRVFSRRQSSSGTPRKEKFVQSLSHGDLDGPLASQSTVQLVKKREPSVQPPPIITNLPQPLRPSMEGISASRSSIDTATLRQSQSTEGHMDSYASLKTPNSAMPLLDSARSPLSPMPPSSSISGTSLGKKRFSQLSHISEQSSAFLMPRSLSRLSQWTDTDTFAALVPRGEVESVREQLRLNLDEREAEDVGVMAEHARPGKPKFDRILADEVERAKGAIAVACCGPTSLDAVMRKVIAAKIDPQRVRRGDMRGSIALFSEEFSY